MSARIEGRSFHSSCGLQEFQPCENQCEPLVVSLLTVLITCSSSPLSTPCRVNLKIRARLYANVKFHRGRARSTAVLCAERKSSISQDLPDSARSDARRIPFELRPVRRSYADCRSTHENYIILETTKINSEIKR